MGYDHPLCTEMWKIITQGMKGNMIKKKKKTNGINYEVWWRMMLGQKNNEEGEPISLWLMKIPNKTYVHQRAPIPV